MREESQLEDMRSAIRGDFERLAERRGDQELMRVVEPEPEVEPSQAEPPPGPDEQPIAAPRRSWLSRLIAP